MVSDKPRSSYGGSKEPKRERPIEGTGSVQAFYIKGDKFSTRISDSSNLGILLSESAHPEDSRERSNEYEEKPIQRENREQGPEGRGEVRQEQLAVAREHAERAKASLSEMRKCMDENPAAWEELAREPGMSQQFIPQLKSSTDDIMRDIERITGDGYAPTPQDGLIMVTTVTAVRGDVDTAQRVAAESGKPRIAKIVAKIRALLDRAAEWIQSLISRLLTPKEWTISGGITFAGMANASISITFGE
ncbi:hypothetical protein [Streptomyces sp. HUAS ZL42]|uniref:hypothetical protein n=1 Tax=Streptomyces sp. HUAS ZL42 TaxID=3231715 RepID=UPI00345EA62A